MKKLNPTTRQEIIKKLMELGSNTTGKVEDRRESVKTTFLKDKSVEAKEFRAISATRQNILLKEAVKSK